ncbi:MAG: NAD(P)H-dependent glycerol-3-phosphate dehydrogenase [Leptospirillia bacterium]
MSETVRITVAGAGSWGTALARLLAENGHRVILWCLEEEVAAGVNESRENTRFLPGFTLPDNLSATTDLSAAAAAARDLLLWVVPTQFSRKVFTQAAPHLNAEVPIVSASKGVELQTLGFVTGIFEDVLGKDPARRRCAALSGPSFAREVAQGAPTAVAVGAWNESVAETVQRLFTSPSFRVYTNPDPIGTQVGGALKNVVAIASGAVEGLGYGHNTEAVLITRGLLEITRLGVALGAKSETFSGLSGMGDLVLTCTGGLSRNRQVGKQLGEGRKLDDILADMQMVAEGVKTTESAWQLAHKLGVEMPIVEQVYRALYEGVSPKDALAELMSRPPRSEEALLDP